MTTLNKAAREALETLRLARDRIVDEGGSGWKALVTRCNRDYMALRAALDEAPGEEREAFEAWAKDEGIDTAYWLGSPDHGYANSRTCDYWTGWQARAMLAARPDAPKVALTEERPWVCRCGANLYIDADGKPRSRA